MLRHRSAASIDTDFGVGRMWLKDPRVASTMRFEKGAACDNCNSIDSCHAETIPGPHFSLSHAEMRRVRAKVGSRSNKARGFNRELEKFGRRPHMIISRDMSEL